MRYGGGVSQLSLKRHDEWGASVRAARIEPFSSVWLKRVAEQGAAPLPWPRPSRAAVVELLPDAARPHLGGGPSAT